MKKSHKKTARTVAFLVLAILLMWISFRNVDFRVLWVIMKKANFWWLIPAAVISIIAFYIRAWRWNLLIEPLGYNPKRINTYHAVVTGYFANMILPRLGEITKCVALSRKEKIPFDKLVGTMLVERTIDILSTIALLGIVLIAGITKVGSFLSENVLDPARARISSSLKSALVVILILAVIGIILIVLYFVLRKKLIGIPFFKKMYSFGDGIKAGLKSILRLKKKREFIFLCILLWICYLFMSFFPLLCLKSTAGLGLTGAIFLLVVGSVGMAAPVQSGIGAYHWLVSRGLLVAYGIPLEEGLTSATLSHESQLILIAICGAISLFILFGKKAGRILTSVSGENGS